jgi:seryl-tRNA synthetase
MPIDINLLRVDNGGDPEKVRESQRRRFAPVEVVDEIIAMDTKWRSMTGDADLMRKARNTLQKEVGKKKKAKEECEDQVAEIKAMGERIDSMEKEKVELKVALDKKLGTIGNIVNLDIPVSKDEAQNKVERMWGTPRTEPGLLNHHDLLWRIGGYEPERGTVVAGHRGYFLKDVGVMLNQAFINYGIAFLRNRKYTVLQPPYMMKKDVMAGVAQLEQFDEELYKVGDGTGNDDKYLIATSEQPICAYHKDDWLSEKELPLRYSGVSTCFRKEAGKHGADTWGIFRVHQFEKVEQFVIVEGDLETSNKMQEEMTACAEEFYQSLGFPYHVINLVSGDLNNAATRKFDLECWFPGYNAYRELVSCSNCTDYQSRAMEIRCGQKKMGDREKKYVHMLNSTLCATGRAICCMLENYQTPEGVRVPEVLQPYIGGMDFLPFVRGARENKGPTSSKASKGPGTATAIPAAATTTAPATAPAAAVAPAAKSNDPKVVALEEKLATKGDEVRKAKADKLPKDDVMALVDQLKALKIELAALSGNVPPAAPSKDATQKKGKKEKTPVAKPPAVPVLAPAYTTAAPKANATLEALPTSVWNGEAVLDMTKLEKWLEYYSYVGGYMPSADDAKALKVVGELAGPNTARWLRNIKSFTDVEKSKW